MDDISAVVLMALLFWLTGDIQNGTDGDAIFAKFGMGLLEFGLKFFLFMVLCYVFACSCCPDTKESGAPGETIDPPHQPPPPSHAAAFATRERSSAAGFNPRR